jgi:hypothetical protein
MNSESFFKHLSKYSKKVYIKWDRIKFQGCEGILWNIMLY